ncbi:MAG TPA: exosortase/archaeosortase family protein [Candidatus Udaeobacter sp.]|nr:exosortase/archaeosortase family protein [Candidatus Udaeobacter sp.]
MQSLATPQKPAETSLVSGRQFSARLALPLLFFGALWFILCRQLSGEWLVNEQYNYGWFVPFFAIYLFWLRWQDRPPAEISNFKFQISNSAALAMAIAALLLLLPVRLVEIASPEWRLLGWIHAASVAVLTLLYLWCVGGKPWVGHFAFPVAFFFVAVPWPTAVEVPIIQGLMRSVADVAAETAMLLGIPAQVEGNLIRVSTGLVGVNEACSGIRSLQTSLMIGLLFGELKRLSVLHRVALVVGAVIMALFANFLRAVFLVTVAATKNVSEVARWHDIAGYTIIALVFVSTMGLAYWLGKSEIRNPKSEIKGQSSEVRSQRSEVRGRWSVVSSPYVAAALCWLLFVEIGIAAWYRAHETNLVSGIRWTVQWPEHAPNFRKLNIDPEIRSVLRFDEGQTAAWMLKPPPSSESSPPAKTSGTQVNRLPPNAVACYLYVFRWNPGRNSALLANLHRPDVCLPASGWTQVADDGVRNYPVTGAFELPFRHFEFQRAIGNSAPQTAHAFYCLSEDRAAESSAPAPTSLPGMTGSRSEWTRAERLRTVLEGRRHLGQQVIEAIFVSNEPFSSAEAESRLRDLVREVVVLREAAK